MALIRLPEMKKALSRGGDDSSLPIKTILSQSSQVGSLFFLFDLTHVLSSSLNNNSNNVDDVSEYQSLLLLTYQGQIPSNFHQAKSDGEGTVEKDILSGGQQAPVSGQSRLNTPAIHSLWFASDHRSAGKKTLKY